MSEALLTQPEPLDERNAAELGFILIGNPNVGKSALFGAMTGAYVTVSNYPGTTVERVVGRARIGAESVDVVDTPGVNSFNPTSEDERVTRDLLLTGRARCVVAVGDAKNIERTLLLAVQLAEMRVPSALALNMTDEAHRAGIRPDAEALSRVLGFAVVPTIAVTGEGLPGLVEAVSRPRPGALDVAYPAAIETAVDRILPLLPSTPIAARSLALMVLSGDPALDAWLDQRAVSHEARATIRRARDDAARSFREPLALVIHQARIREAWRLAEEHVDRTIGAPSAGRRLARWLERGATHPVWGVPVLAAVLAAAYGFVGVLGAGTLVGLLEDGLFNGWINPTVTALADRWIGWPWLRDLFVGPYGVVTMALTYSLALVLPIVGTFFVAFGILEDSGYLPRLAVMVNKVFKRMGLNGKAVLPMVLGLGCDTMATLTTRILETKKERLIVILLLALGVPCSAQLTVVLAMLGSLSVTAMAIWLGVVVATILAVGALAARVIPGRSSDFVLELPPMRLPRARNIFVKTLARIEWYLKEAVPLFVLGTLILFVADRLDLLRLVERLVEPILGGLLGLPRETAAAFIIGFLRRDFGAAGLYHLAQEGRLDPIGVVTAVVTITLFVPCIANFFMMVKERGWRTGLAIAAFIFPFAVAVGASVNWLLRALHVTL